VVYAGTQARGLYFVLNVIRVCVGGGGGHCHTLRRWKPWQLLLSTDFTVVRTKNGGKKDGKRTGSRGDVVGILVPKFSMFLIRNSLLLVFSVFLRRRNTEYSERFQGQSPKNILKVFIGFSVCGPLICAIFEMRTVEKYSKIKFLSDSLLSQVNLFNNGFSGLQAAVYRYLK
jgi:hypothetical protein